MRRPSRFRYSQWRLAGSNSDRQTSHWLVLDCCRSDTEQPAARQINMRVARIKSAERDRRRPDSGIGAVLVVGNRDSVGIRNWQIAQELLRCALACLVERIAVVRFQPDSARLLQQLEYSNRLQSRVRSSLQLMVLRLASRAPPRPAQRWPCLAKRFRSDRPASPQLTSKQRRDSVRRWREKLN